MLASSKVSCLGCNHYFSAGRGLLSHLRQTTNQRCKTILQGFQANVQDEQAGPTEDPHQQTSDFSSETIMHLLIFQDGTTTAQTMVQHHREIYSRTRSRFRIRVKVTLRQLDVDVEEDEEDEADAEVEMSYGGEAVEESLRQKIFIESFPGNTAGTPVPGAEVQGAMRPAEVVQGDPYSPFASQMDWQIARWAKLRGQGSTAMSELLGVPGLQDALHLSYKDSCELNRIIDEQLPSHRPRFQRAETELDGVKFDVYYRDVIACSTTTDCVLAEQGQGPWKWIVTRTMIRDSEVVEASESGEEVRRRQTRRKFGVHEGGLPERSLHTNLFLSRCYLLVSLAINIFGSI
ncbi:hypothetical protein BC629DRAFT_1541305 [Irpex lacteus]|nr:hypothetical protein BC629DRAFT_1541305 [Irpex lacteus]